MYIINIIHTLYMIYYTFNMYNIKTLYIYIYMYKILPSTGRLSPPIHV